MAGSAPSGSRCWRCGAITQQHRPAGLHALGAVRQLHARAGQATYDSDAEPGPSTSTQPQSFGSRLRNLLFGGKLDKQRLRELGLGAIISYGFVSNFTYGAVFTIGWASHVAATGLTPFAQGQWPSFMGRVTGLLVAQQLLRPLRFSCAVAITPFVDRMMSVLQRRFKLSRRAAFATMFVSLAALTLAGYGAALTAVTVRNMPQAA